MDVSPSSLLSSDVWVSRALLCLLLSLTAVGAVAPVWGAETFGLIPGKTLATWPLWTFVTAAAFDTHTTTVHHTTPHHCTARHYPPHLDTPRQLSSHSPPSVCLTLSLCVTCCMVWCAVVWCGVQGVLHAGVLCLLCPALERGVGSRRVLLLVLVVVLCVHVSLFVCLVSLYALTESEGFLFNVWCGASSVTAAVLVALKQRWPDSPALPISASSLTLLSRLQVQHLPFLACCLSVLLGLVGWVGGKEAPLMLLGVLYSFLYLRFYQRDPDTGAVGDMRSDFAFATLFPDVLGLRGVVNLAATVPFHALMRAGAFSEAIKSAALLPPTSINGAGEAAPPSGSDATALLVGSANLRAVDPQAERRRILAIKAIDEKLAQLAQHHQHQQQQPHDSSHSVAQLSPSSAAVSSGSSSTSTSSLPAGSADAVDSIDQSSLPGEEELQRMEREVTAGMQQPQPPHLQSADAAAQRRATVEGGAHAGEVAISVRSEEAPAQRSQGFP